MPNEFCRTHCLTVGDPQKPKLCTIHGGNGITTLNLKLFLPLLSDYCIIAPLLIIASANDIFFPAEKVFDKAKRIFKGKITTVEIDSKHLPSEEAMIGICKQTIDFLK